jgi:putative ABC transport system permease protein
LHEGGRDFTFQATLTFIPEVLFGLQPADPVALAFAISLMFVVGVLASYIPARRAMRVDPMVALRYE